MTVTCMVILWSFSNNDAKVCKAGNRKINNKTLGTENKIGKSGWLGLTHA
ncbi:hypothetical protein C427_1183 [Paraglaciecola psychrophila 170]|uniref:Uncharacterized protein n=1 Tax=Paraglaciecola psychrophila 170 TaxID=1129794 RepID=K6YWC9_9ALTE|nr:hypothetical protein C427_1183 [Paraglaciecola psychrophila 170]GAC37019.1 hypothetical protein GPSY_1384 [Paraglaciecola psychrophila 170]